MSNVLPNEAVKKMDINTHTGSFYTARSFIDKVEVPWSGSSRNVLLLISASIIFDPSILHLKGSPSPRPTIGCPLESTPNPSRPASSHSPVSFPLTLNHTPDDELSERSHVTAADMW